MASTGGTLARRPRLELERAGHFESDDAVCARVHLGSQLLVLALVYISRLSEGQTECISGRQQHEFRAVREA